jgi:hypothetical protein
MTLAPTARPRTPAVQRLAVAQLAWIEGGRMLRHPAPWLGLATTAWFASGVFEQDWAAAHYEGLLASMAPLLLGVSVAAISSAARGQVPLAVDAPVGRTARALARLLGGLALVALVAAATGAGAVWLHLRGGLRLGDEPGRTDAAVYTAPELLQPVLLAALAVVLGAVLVRLLRSPLGATIAAFAVWFLSGTVYWVLDHSVLLWLTPVQIQPVSVPVGPPTTDPGTFQASWLLSSPGEHQEQWIRLVVSPALSAWHDVYLFSLVLLLGAAVVPGRFRRPVALGAGALLVVAVLAQRAVMP